MLPFANEVVSFQLTGAQLLDVLKYAIGAILPGRERGGFLGGLGAMSVTATIDDIAEGSSQVAIDKVLVEGSTLDPAAIYNVLTNTYIASGGDGYAWPVEGEVIGTLLREVTQTYLEMNNPYTPGLGRLFVTNPTSTTVAVVNESKIADDVEVEEVAKPDVASEVAGQCNDDSCAGPEVEA